MNFAVFTRDNELKNDCVAYCTDEIVGFESGVLYLRSHQTNKDFLYTRVKESFQEICDSIRAAHTRNKCVE